MIGPFFYICDEDLNFKGFLYHALPEDKCEKYGDNITSPVGHSELFDNKFMGTGKEYFNYPRGRVVYNIPADIHILYLDKCLEGMAEKIAQLFVISKYKIEHDDHYICPTCVDINDIL